MINDPAQGFTIGPDAQMYEDDRTKRLQRRRLVGYALSIALWLTSTIPLARLVSDDGGAGVAIYLGAGLAVALAIRGVYRGTNPDDAIAPAVVASLSRDGIAVEGKPVKVTAADVEHANTVVTFACKLPDTGRKHAQQFDWNEIPSPTADVEAARREIRRQVGELLDKMQAGQH